MEEFDILFKRSILQITSNARAVHYRGGWSKLKASTVSYSDNKNKTKMKALLIIASSMLGKYEIISKTNVEQS